MQQPIDSSAGLLQRLCAKQPLWFVGLCLSLVYFVLAKLGLYFTVVVDNVTLIWPPSGLALFALLVLGIRFWPWIMLGAFITNLSTGIPLLACLGIATGNSLGAVVGLYLLSQLGFDIRLARVRDVLHLTLFAAGISTMVSASVGTMSLAAFGIIPWLDYSSTWAAWWMGDAMGVLVFTPLLLSWWFRYPRPVSRLVMLEALLLMSGVGLLCAFVFGGQALWFDESLPLSYMTFPFLIWAAMRFGLRGVTSTILLIGGMILITIMYDLGPFARGETVQSLTLLWLYTNFMAITSLVLTTAIEERQAAVLGMRHMAEHDDLTHLPNRRALVDRIDQAIAHADREAEKFALLFLDLDRFKVINDTLGHSLGDKVLTVMSRRLLECVRREDTVSRLGGDEFVVLVHGVHQLEDIYIVSNKIIASMREPIFLDGSELHSSVSIGICLYPGDGRNAETLLKHADIAMYRAKDAGRDNYQFYAPEMNVRIETLMSIDSELRHALENNEFELYYQPQYSVEEGTIKGCEALLRWCKQGETCTGPDLFIPVLEETGQIKKVGTWVVEEACRQLAEWNAAGWPALRMSVNISSHQLTDPEMPDMVAQSLSQYRIKPECLELEITESMLVRQETAVENVIQRLIALGVRLAVDDFGTGYSSLNYLHRLSIDTLKVDRSFIAQIPGNANSETITRAIIALGKSLQLTVVAEGIENSEQCGFISKLGCDYVQGFLLSRPVTAQEFSQLLRSGSQALPGQICNPRS